MRNKKRILLSISVLGLISSLFFALPSKNFQSVEASVGNHTTGTNDTDYYSNFDFNKEGQEMLAQVHDLMVSTHKTYPSYDDSGKNEYQLQTDAYYSLGGTPSAGYIHDFYTGVKIKGEWDQGATYNREHVWCQSLSAGLWGTSGGGSDMHHIRPTISGINGARGNKKYGVIANRDSYQKKFTINGSSVLGGYTNGNDSDSSAFFEPIDDKKGDVARIVLYVYAHYNNSNSSIFGGYAKVADSKFSSNLPITNVVAGTNSEALSMLVEWNKGDPVDPIETRRNDQVAIYQGNRNVFIDHPELVDTIWGDNSSGVVGVKSINIEKDTYDLAVGGELQINATVLPSNATDKSITWSSSDPKIATISNTGSILGLKKGTVTITAKTNDGGFTDTCTVKVGDIALSGKESFAITINSFAKTSNYGTLDQWKSYDSEHSSYVGYSDLSSTTDYMQINSSGASSAGGFYNETTTPKALTSFKFTTAYKTQTKEQNFTLYLSQKPLTKSNYSSADSLKASNIVGNSVSYTFNIDQSKDYRYFYFISGAAAYLDSIVVSFGKDAIAPTSISLSNSSLTLEEDSSDTISATISPSNAVQDDILWESSNTLVATVNNGKVTAIKKGNATITAKLKNYPNISATCSVTVTENVQPEQPEDPIPTTNGVLVVDDKTTTSANLTTGKYLIVAKANNTYKLLNSSSVSSSGKYNPVSVSNLINLDSYTSGTFTITKTNTNVSIYSDSTSKYFGNSGDKTDFAAPQSNATTWSYKDSGEGILFTSTANAKRGLIYRAGSYNVFGFYAVSNVSGGEYSAPHLYKVDTAFNFLVNKLKEMDCSIMLDSTFNGRIQYLFSKLSSEERTTLSSLNIKCNDGKTYSAYDAYLYAISQFNAHHSQYIILGSDINNDLFINITIIFSMLAIVGFGIVIHKKRANLK